MISKLPKWIELGAFVLAFIAGCLNAIGLLSFGRQAVSHVSGTVTLLSTSIVEDASASFLQLLGVLAAFLIGAAISGYLLPRRALKLGRHYDTALFIETALIFIAFFLLSNNYYYGYFAISAACGIQNALITTYSGAIVRTTHLTGIFTDLGIMLGTVIRGESLDVRRAILFLLIILGFMLGGLMGAFLYHSVNYLSLIAPGSICFILAMSYRVYRVKSR